jgi:PAS domain S-box-containing protein
MTQSNLVSSVSHLTAIINSVPTALVMINAEGTIVLVNTQSEKLFGYLSEQLLGEPLELLVPHRFRAAHPSLRNEFFGNPSARPWKQDATCSV